MASQFVDNLKAFLDLHSHGEKYSSYALYVSYELLAEDNSGKTFRENMAAIQGAEAAAYYSLKKKVFPAAKLEELRDKPSEWLQKLEPQASGKILCDTSALEELMELRTDDGRTQLEALASKRGMTAEDFRAKVLSEVGTSLRNQELAKLNKPSIHSFLLRRFARQLDEIVEELERLDELTLEWDFIPSYLQTLLSEAHEAALFGKTVAAAVLFGAALEEALKEQLGRDRYKNLGEGISLAVQSGLLAKPSPAYVSVCKIQHLQDSTMAE
jgi:hypothetical protein